MSDKRKSEMSGESSSKKMKFNVWGKQTEVVMKKLSELVMGKSKNEIIKFRVCFKSELKKISTGFMFTFHMFDGEVEFLGAAFSPEAERLFDLMHFDKIYQVEHFKVRQQQKHLAFKNFELQVVLEASSNISEVDDDLPKFEFTFSSIESIQLLEKDSKCDYLGVFCKDWGTETTSTDKVKRDLSFTDKTKETIIVTLWGKRAETFTGKENQIFAIRYGSVFEFDDTKGINVFSNSLLWPDPQIPEAVDLKNWYITEIENIGNC